jgi:hypothetical protein
MKAKGIPNRSLLSDPESLPLDIPLTFVEQLHDAKRAGRHVDFRMGTPSSGMVSWALPKGLPTKPGDKRLAITQPLHSWSYNDFEGTIGKGYGSGTVKQQDKGQLVLVERRPGMFRFTRTDQRNPPVYTMVRTPNRNWLIFIQNDGDEDSILHYDKEHFRSVSPAAVRAMMTKGAIAAPKLDGAAALARIRRHGVDVYSVRRDKDGRLIRYTDHIGGLRGMTNPADLVGRVIRGEVIAERDGKVLPPQEISGLLNSNLGKVLEKRRQGIRMRMAALGLMDNGIEDYDPDKVADVVRRLKTPAITGVPVYRTPDEAEKALASMASGEHPLTGEGLVLYPTGGRPIKAKLTEEQDVVVDDIFPSKAEGRAGGFSYRLPDGDGPVGRVGTGFDFPTLRDMMNNPEKYRGRTARIRSQGQFPSGAYRAPSFISLHEG